MTTAIDPADLTATREALHRVAEHLLAATRKRATGEITLQAGPEGFRTPPLPDGTVLGIDGVDVVVTGPDGARRERLTTLARAAAFAGVPAGFPWTKHPPATPFEPEQPLTVDPAAAAALVEWFQLGHQALAILAAGLTSEQPSDPQLFPEHFDLGITAASVNYGCSPGDAAIAVPYLYVGPHQLPPPEGDYWNAPFGAYRTWDEVGNVDLALEFLRTGHDALAGR